MVNTASRATASESPFPFDYADRFVRRDQAHRAFGDLAERYGRLQLVGDPVADAWVADAMSLGPEARAVFERALELGIDRIRNAPESLRAFFAAVDVPPAWVDFERMRLGARTFQRIGPAQGFILSAWSLMNGYHSSAAVKPLAFTGQLEKMAPRRLAETGRFVTEVTQTDGMHRYARGFETTLRVRAMHAMVRRMLLRSDRWDTKAWGVPINQADMVGTVIEFSLLLLAGAEKMGFRFEKEEREALIHMWRYVGHVSGVDATLLAELSSEERGMQLALLAKLVQPGPDEDSVALAAALRRVPGQLARTDAERRLAPWVIRYHDGLTWVFNGDEIAEALQIPNRAWRHAIWPTRVAVGAIETARRFVPFGTPVLAWLGNRRVRENIRLMLEDREPTFHPAPSHAPV